MPAVCGRTPQTGDRESANIHGPSAQRSIRRTWCTPEPVKAQEKGIIHEVYHFPPEQRKVGLFWDYIDTWLKDKTEASG